MLRQLIFICAIGGVPLVSTAAGTAATEAIQASEDAAKESSSSFACTQAQASANPTQGPVWVVQGPVQTPAQQGPVWVVQQERPAKPMS
jgi:hypothetical protein